MAGEGEGYPEAMQLGDSGYSLLKPASAVSEPREKGRYFVHRGEVGRPEWALLRLAMVASSPSALWGERGGLEKSDPIRDQQRREQDAEYQT